jgi:hypothetical protein
MSDAVGEGQAERSADDPAQDGAADVAAAQVRAEGTRQAKSEEDRDKIHRDPKARRLKHLDQVNLTELPASVDACEDCLRIGGNCSTSGSA